ncbi:MAG: helix-turn-helix domain-containing protein [Bacteroidales bacterium]|nr:helix-turn-helix domain-containing protein [Lachnospiraceae bacterium]MBR3441802.1 helix-turn-helix domain-containing protein [Bacteroidales bacterium]
MSYKVYRTLQRTQGKMLREYFSGMPVEDLSKRYGYSEKKIISLASEYKQGKIDIFDDRDKRRIALSMMSHEEEVRLLQDKIKALENALKLSNIKVEGYEIMMHILKDEYGIDLSKKAEAGQSTNSKGDTRK